MTPTLPFNQFDAIEIPAPDIESAKVFYSTVFGWKLEPYGKQYCCFNDGRLTGGLSAERRVSEGGPLLVICVEDIDTAMDRIIKFGGRLSVPKFAFPGGKRAHFIDPNGNELAVWQEQPKKASV
ncbi:MAG: VOC family protein [Methylacidiphilales bacterium]|nr:VOC family protein [Candidatus Methylacidiphilales bacterium]